MQVRKFESPEWWTRSIYSMSTAERNMAEWVAGEPKVTPYRSGLYEEDELKLLAKTFGDCKEYFDVGFSTVSSATTCAASTASRTMS